MGLQWGSKRCWLCTTSSRHRPGQAVVTGEVHRGKNSALDTGAAIFDITAYPDSVSLRIPTKKFEFMFPVSAECAQEASAEFVRFEWDICYAARLKLIAS